MMPIIPVIICFLGIYCGVAVGKIAEEELRDGRKYFIILEDLLRTEALERAMQQFFVGQKRFSLEGSEGIIPGLHFLVDSANRYEIEEFVIGTTHRGRLSILNTILHMNPVEIFSVSRQRQ